MRSTRGEFRAKLEALQHSKRGRERITEAYGRLFFARDCLFLSPPKMRCTIDALVDEHFPKPAKSRRR